MYPYFLRAKQSHYSSMIEFLKTLNIVRETEEGIMGISPFDFDKVFGDGILYEDGKPITLDNETLIHVNLLSRTDLSESFRYSPFMLQDENGYPKAPNSPRCVFIASSN